MPTMEFKPDPDTETSSVDGTASYDSAFDGEDTWSNVVAGTGSTSDDSSSSKAMVEITSGATTDQWAVLRRGIFVFDISGLPANSTIDVVGLEINGGGKADSFTTPIGTSLNVYTATTASNTAIAAGDYDGVSTQNYSDAPISYASWNTSGYNTWDFNATGVSYVQARHGGDEIVKVSVRDATYDVADNSPTWEANKSMTITANFAESANDPILRVTYTEGTTTSTTTSTTTTSTSTTTTTSTSTSTSTSTTTTSTSTTTTTTSTSTTTSTTTSTSTSTTTTTTSTSTTTTTSTSTSTSTTTTTTTTSTSTTTTTSTSTSTSTSTTTTSTSTTTTTTSTSTTTSSSTSTSTSTTTTSTSTTTTTSTSSSTSTTTSTTTTSTSTTTTTSSSTSTSTTTTSTSTTTTSTSTTTTSTSTTTTITSTSSSTSTSTTFTDPTVFRPVVEVTGTTR